MDRREPTTQLSTGSPEPPKPAPRGQPHAVINDLRSVTRGLVANGQVNEDAGKVITNANRTARANNMPHLGTRRFV